MDKKNLIIIVAGILIIICLVFGLSEKDKSKTDNDANEKVDVSLEYREVSNEITDEKTYQIYNPDTGEIVTEVKEEYQIQMYLDNPDFVEADIDENMDSSYELESAPVIE